jgi:para-aminobenzoate synthetase component 1
LAATSPAPYAAWWRGEDEALVSNSPEQFLQVNSKGLATTRPIKGTRPRGATPHADAALAKALQNSAKDRAENLMIVDLMRNDLARQCRPGSVRVSQMCALESYANVHHLVSTIEGQLTDDASAMALFLDALPPGSVTGAPKVQAIRELGRHEPPRGAFCGSLFWAGFDGALDSSVLIRTAAFCRHGAGEWRYDVRAGAGITADSAPDDEADEVEAKAAMLLAALQGCAP